MELPSYISIVICALVGLVLLFIKFSKLEVSITITNYLITFSPCNCITTSLDSCILFPK